MRAVLAPLLALLVLGALAAAQRLYYAPRLPPQIAAHIGTSGKVDRWEDREQFLAGTAYGWLMVPAIFGGLGLINVLAVLVLPYAFINLPNKAYWLATPGRRVQAAMLLLNFWLWVMAGGAALGVGVTQAMIEATLSGREWIALPVVAGFIVFLVARSVLLLVRLSRGPAPRAARSRHHA